MPLIITFCSEPFSSKNGVTTIECTLYGKNNNQYIEQYYNKLNTALHTLKHTDLKKNYLIVRDAGMNDC